MTIRRMRGGCEDEIVAAEQRGFAAGQAAQREADAAEVRTLANGWREGGEPTHSFMVTSMVIQELDYAVALIRAAQALPAPGDGERP